MSFYDIRFVCPSRFVIIGPSGSGKTNFVFDLLNNCEILFNHPFTRIVYIYGQTEPPIQKTSNGILIETVNGLENIMEIIESIKSSDNNCLVLDDLMNEIIDQKIMSDLFTKVSRHMNITVILLMQNLYPKGKYTSNISRNCNYIVLMNNPRDKSQIKTLDTQVYGKGSNFIQKCFNDATKNKPFGYLLLDFDQKTPDNLRVRSNIFPTDENHTVYITPSKK